MSARTNAPPWVQDLHYASDLSNLGSFAAAWSEAFSASARYRRPSTEANGKSLQGLQSDTLSLTGPGNYTVSSTIKKETFRLVQPARLALPPPDNSPVDVRSFLEWPMDMLFSDESMAFYKRTPTELAALTAAGKAPTRAVCHMAEGHAYHEAVLALMKAKIVQLYTLKNAPPGPDNGFFAVKKNEALDRFIIANCPGNFHWDQVRFQQRYTDICNSDPERTARLKLPSKVMDICGPEALAKLPPGADDMSHSDFENFYYGVRQLPGFLGSQRLPPVEGKLVGRPEEAWVVPVVEVLAMGCWVSALLSQLVHRALHKQRVAAPTVLLRPHAQSSTRQRHFADLKASANADGFVKLKDVSPVLCPPYAGPALPEDFLVPVGAFAYEVLGQDRASDVSPEATIALHTVLISTGSDVTFKLQCTKAAAKVEGRSQAISAASLYIDDDATVLYGPHAAGRTGSFVRSEAPDHALGNLCRLLAVFSSQTAGLRQSWKKLHWASARPGVALGLSYQMQSGRQRAIIWQVAPERRQRTVRAIEAVLNSKADRISDDLLDTIMGNVVWEILVNRCFLSIFQMLYKALNSPNKPPGAVLLTPALREELWLVTALSPCFYHESASPFHTAATFDASGVSRVGNGGYGVALRRGLSPLVAAEFATAVDQRFGKLPAFLEPEPGMVPVDRSRLPEHFKSATAASKFLRFDWQASPADHTYTPIKPTWRAAIHGEFHVAPRHVDVAEAVAGGMAARRLSASVGARGHCLTIGGDNTASLNALRKGRSSVRDINAVCRRVACTSFITNTSVNWFWMPSLSNPADGPSRWWYDSKKRLAARLQEVGYKVAGYMRRGRFSNKVEGL